MRIDTQSLVNPKRVFIILVTIALAFLSFTSKKEPNPIISPDNRPMLTSSNYGKVVLTLPDYNVV